MVPDISHGRMCKWLRFANEIEDAGLEWPNTDAIGPEGWHYQLRVTMAAALARSLDQGPSREGGAVMSVIEFPNAGPRRRALCRSSARDRKNMQTLLFRSRELIVESDETDLVRDVSLDIDRAQRKLQAIRHRLQGVKEQAATQVQFLTAAEIKLAAAIVAALLSGQR